MTAASDESSIAIENNFIDYHLEEKIVQMDGFDDFEEEKQMVKNIFAINCEQVEIIEFMTFFRSFNKLWLDSEFHLLCDADESCFFFFIFEVVL